MDQERNAILTIAVMAALADGKPDPAERQAMMDLAQHTTGDYEAALKAVLSRTVNLADTAKQITTPEGKKLAYEIAAVVCNADGASNDAEAKFLDALRDAFALNAADTSVRKDAETLANLPVVAAGAAGTAGAAPGAKPNDAETDKMILNYSILNGALELMPETLSTMAIIPLQMKMVYKIAKSHGFELGREHIRDFLATLGVGLTSQYLEGFARKILGGVLGKIGGKVLGGVGKQAASSGMSFVTTYALGQAAKRYYAGGRNFEAVKLKELYQSMLADAKTLSQKYAGEIQQKAAGMKSADVMKVVKEA
jgi:uncharacterized protein (DUF697 family)/tellurite resistance protein